MLNLRILLVCSLMSIGLSHADKSMEEGKTFDFRRFKDQKQFIEAYSELNSFLVENVDEKDAETNVNFALEYYREKEAQGENLDSPFMIALHWFSSMHYMFGEEKCSYKSYFALKQNYQGCRFRANFQFWDATKRRLSRVESIVKELVQKHARECQGEYVKIFNQRFPELDKSKLEQLENLFGLRNFVTSQASVGTDLFEGMTKNGGNFFSTVLTADRLYRNLRAVSKGDKMGKFLSASESEMERVDPKRFEMVYNKYKVEPCQYLEDQLASDVFEPLKFDSAVAHVVDNSQPEFYYAWTYYFMCHWLEEDRVNPYVFGFTIYREMQKIGSKN